MSVKGAVKFFEEKLEYETTPADVSHMVEKGDKEHVIVDVRDADSYKKSHVLGAVNIPAGEMEKRMGELPKDKTIVLYCYNDVCFAAPRMALFLAKKGFKTMDMVGGFKDYQDLGYPVESG